jgi:hypothetical protein
MRLKLSIHFQGRLTERGINMDHLKSAIRNPDASEIVFAGRTRVQKKINGKMVEVVYFKEGSSGKGETFVIITAYYL